METKDQSDSDERRYISQTLVLIFGCIGNIILYSIPQTRFRFECVGNLYSYEYIYRCGSSESRGRRSVSQLLRSASCRLVRGTSNNRHYV